MTTTNVRKALFPMLTLAAMPLLPGCAVGPAAGGSNGDEIAAEEEKIGEAEQAISCVDGTCTSVSPYSTNCVLDQQVKSSGAINGPSGQIGTATLYYSPTCHAIWGYASFNAAHGSFQVCAQNVTWLGQPAQCLSYGSTTFGAVSPMQYLRVNDTGYASVLVNSPTVGSGGTGTFKRLF